LQAYAGGIVFRTTFFAVGLAAVYAAGFSTTGPCVSAVGGGGASPLRFE